MMTQVENKKADSEEKPGRQTNMKSIKKHFNLPINGDRLLH